MSSNGGAAMFMETYRTASDGWIWTWSLRFGSVSYFWSWSVGGTPSKTSSSSPESTLAARSSVEAEVIWMSISSTYAPRRSSVDLSQLGFRTNVIDLPGTYPAAGFWPAAGLV